MKKQINKKVNKVRNVIFPFLICLFLANSMSAKTWRTVTGGAWSSGVVWEGGVAPPYISADTFLIRTPITINSTLNLNTGAYLKIDSTGGICGHERLTVNTGALVVKYGVLDLDTLYISGGTVYCYPPEEVILSFYGILSGVGSSLHVTSGMQVGPWFDCRVPEYTFLSKIENVSKEIEFTAFPNPFSSSTTLKTGSYLRNATLLVYNLYGELVKEIQNISGETIIFSRDNLPSGLYFLNIIEGSKIILSDKLIITDN